MNPRELRNIGRYQVRRFIAEGGMAWVFEVEDPTFEGRRLALKMLKPEAAEGDQFRRFESEARLLAAINHPNLVTIFDMGTDEESGCYYYTMTLVDGPPLSERDVLSVDEACPIFLEVLAGLATLHDRGIVHRDIKPANILLHSDGRAVLADLGIARVENQASDLTKTMMAIGTVRYMSPEQARGRQVGPTSDVLSVGLTLYQAITGRSVYDAIDGIDASSGQSILFYLGSMSSRSGSELPLVFGDDIPKPLRRVLIKACRFEAQNRYANAGEMRHALLDASRQNLAAVGSGLRVSPTLIGGTLLGVTAAAAIAWYASSTIEQTNALESREKIGIAQTAATEILTRTGSLSPPVPLDLIESMRKSLDHAEIFVKSADDKLEGSNHDGALELLGVATTSYKRACSELLNRDLNERADAMAVSARARVSEMDSRESRALLPEAFAELDRLVAALVPPDPDGEPCNVGMHQFTRLQTSGEIATHASLLNRDLQAEWPKQAERAKNAAVAARQAATRVESSIDIYTESLQEGREAMTRGDSAASSGDHLVARRAYREAREAFEFAASTAPAARAKQDAMARLKRSDEDLKKQRIVQRQLDSAQALFADKRWDEAKTEFEQLGTLIDSLAADRKSASAALAAADISETLRTAADREGATGSAPEPFAKAEQAHMAAIAALEAKKYAVAESGFKEAQTFYTDAKRVAALQLREARKTADRTAKAANDFIPGGDCGQLGGPAQSPCGEAQQSEKLGLSALADRNAPDAIASLNHARHRYEAAAKAQTAFVKNRPQPPFLVKRVPEESIIRAYRNTKVPFSIEVEDPNPRDVLTHTWRVDGKRVGNDMPNFTYEGDRDARVSVSVDDGHDGRIEQEWQLSFRNRKPELRLSPSARTVTMVVGERRKFRADGRDPDGESLRYSYLVNGQQVASSPRYTFVADQPGQFELRARAIDGGGASANSSVKIEVKAKPAPPPVVAIAKPAATKPKVDVPAPKPPTPQASPKPQAPKEKKAKPPPKKPVSTAKQPENAGRTALREYESAYEARDVGRLGRIWIMNRNQKKALGDFFRNVTGLSMDVKIVGVTVDDRSVYIDFDQTITGKGKANFGSKSVPMTATVIPQGGGKWVISSILGRD